MGDLTHKEGDRSSPVVTRSGDIGYDVGDLHARTRLQTGDLTLSSGDLVAHNGQETVETGDFQVSNATLSSIDSVFIQKASSQKLVELESKTIAPLPMCQRGDEVMGAIMQEPGTEM